MDESRSLKHYGVPGMKWGHRKASQLDYAIKQAKSTRNKSKLKAIDASDRRSNKNFDSNPGATKSGFIKGKSNRQAFRKAEDSNIKQLKSDYKKADAKYKQDVINAKKQAVKKYDKKFNEAEKASNLADKKWEQANEQYKSLGKNKVQRMINAARNNTEAARKYNKMYDEASKASDVADSKWKAAKREYVNTGRNRVEAIINNIKYGS